MNPWKFQVRGEVEIDAPLEYVYAFASDPAVVPRYAEEIERIELVERLSSRVSLVTSHLKILGFEVAFPYRFNYRRPEHYSGVQRGRSVLRGFFAFAFTAEGNKTKVIHSEGLFSTVPLLAPLAGFIHYRLVHRRGIERELRSLKELVESSLSGISAAC